MRSSALSGYLGNPREVVTKHNRFFFFLKKEAGDTKNLRISYSQVFTESEPPQMNVLLKWHKAQPLFQETFGDTCP